MVRRPTYWSKGGRRGVPSKGDTCVSPSRKIKLLRKVVSRTGEDALEKKEERSRTGEKEVDYAHQG